MKTKILALAVAAILVVALLASLPRIVSAQGTTTTGCGLVLGSIASQISTNEPWYCPINQQIYSQWVGYLPLGIAMVLISFFIAGIIFMIGVALNNTRIRNFGVGELYEAIATAIIVVAFLYLSAVMFGLLPGLYVADINPYATAFNLMTKTIGTAEQMYTSLFNVYFSLSFATSPQVILNIGGALSGLAKTLLNFIGYAPQLFVNLLTIPITIFFLDPAVAIGGFLVDGIAALYAEYYLLVFFSVAAIPVFLVPGVLFRSLFPTRALGGILIAFAFGFYLVMPALFAVAYYFTAPTVQRDMGLSTLQMQRLGNTEQNAASATSPLAEQLSNVKSSLNGFWLLIFFYPPLIIAITYAAIREIANFIGRAPFTAGRMRSFI
ncbi:MAG: hypothetical protein KGI06_02455 [Candidatus Micrarchaeota archaeon]|nr:hypothetical protein [Candidatus Micrarchaeota archaeon]